MKKKITTTIAAIKTKISKHRKHTQAQTNKDKKQQQQLEIKKKSQ